jgi:hypothetical protein
MKRAVGDKVRGVRLIIQKMKEAAIAAALT